MDAKYSTLWCLICVAVYFPINAPCSCLGMLRHIWCPRPVQVQLVLLFRNRSTQSLVLLSRQPALSHLPERKREMIADWLLIGFGTSLDGGVSQHTFYSWHDSYSFKLCKRLSGRCRFQGCCIAFGQLPWISDTAESITLIQSISR